MEINLYNTLTRRKEPLSPINPGLVKIYTCGLTVYDYAHIGNLRSYMFADILERVLRANGLKTEHIENITDVGHLVGDGDEGEDKMSVGAKKQGKTAWEIAEFFTEAYKKDREALNILPPSRWIKATDTIQEQIEFVQELEKKGFTYKISDGIYFDTSKLSDYGKLARLDLEGLQEGARVVVNKEKKNPTDFALWKFSPEGPKRDMQWESPWGIGFPGWHIECSAMSRKFLGFPFDIHTGGIDHVPVHHTNEIAQNEGAYDTVGANVWMHNEHVLVDSGKMSKSLGNFFTIANLIEKGYSPIALRYLYLGTHYRQRINFTFEALDGAAAALGNLTHRLESLKDAEVAPDYKSKMLELINDDLSTPKALAHIWETLNSSKNIDIEFTDELLGLGLGDQVAKLGSANKEVPEEVEKLAREREQARQNKDWSRADELRKEIEKFGYQVSDIEGGYKIEKL